MEIQTLKKNKEFAWVYSRGKSCATRRMAMVYLPRRYDGVRVGFSVSKKIGCSVERNRVRRRLKEAFRVCLPQVKGSVNLIFIARSAISQADYWDMLKDMRYLLRKAALTPPQEKKKAE